MEPRMCMTVHNPPKSYGDCIRACIATLADDDRVPHVFNDETPAEESWHQIRSYLKSVGKFLFLVGVDDPFDETGENNPSIPYMLICGTNNGNHAVICKNGVVVHNPAYYKSEITGPPAGSDEWVIGVVGDITWNK